MALVKTNGTQFNTSTGEFHAVQLNLDGTETDLGPIKTATLSVENATVNVGDVGLVDSNEDAIDPATSQDVQEVTSALAGLATTEDVEAVTSAVEALATVETVGSKAGLAVSVTDGNRQTLKTATEGKAAYLLSLDITVTANATVVSVCQDDDGAGTNESVIASWTFAQYGGLSVKWDVSPATAAGKYLTLKVSGGNATGFATAGVEI
ncbi:MAG: hypothetical protein BIFFINMI_03887 [Phycisphaerae bacterium]|nr:hypothetical protein [Phycisphaerae bacterium]